MKIAIAIISTFVASVATFAASPGEQVASIRTDSLINAAVEVNPEVKISRQRADAELLKAQGENTLPAPEVSFSHLWGTGTTGNKWGLELSQSFDWPGAYSARANAGKEANRAANIGTERIIAETRYGITDAVNSIVHCNRRLKLVDEMLERLEFVSSKVREGYDHGEMNLLDVRKIDYELLALKNRRSDIFNERSEAIASLNAIAGTTIVGSEKLSGYPSLTLKPLNYFIQTVDGYIPAQEAIATAGALRAEARAEKLAQYPGFSVGYNHEYEMGERFNGLSVGISLPFVYGNKRAKAASLMAESYEAEADNASNKRHTEINEAYNRAMELSDRLSDARQLFSSSNDYATLLYKAYQGGEISLINYLLEINYYIEASLDYLDTEYRYNNQLNTLYNIQ